MDSKRLLTTALAVLGLLIGSLAATAARPAEASGTAESDEPAVFRAELAAMAERVAATRGSDAEGARSVADRIAALPPAELAAFEERLERMPGWRALPDVLAELDRKALEREHRVASRAVSRLQAPTEAEEMETFRSDLLLFVDRLATYEPLVADPAGFAARLDTLRERILAIPTDQLHHLKTGFERNAPIWQRALSRQGSSPGAGQPADRPGALGRKALDLTIDFEGIDCSFGCGDACELNCGTCCDPGPPLCNPVCLACEAAEGTCKLGCEAAELVCGGLNDAITEVVGVINQITGFLDDFFEDIDGVFDEIAGLPGEIEEFFLGIFSDLESHLLSIVSTLAGPVDELLAVSSPADALSLLGLDGLDASFFEDLAESVPTLDLPCPDMDTEIPGIGTVGSARAEYACRRGIDWVAHLIYDLVPDDVFAVPVKVPATFVYYPINYFCLCMEAQSTLSFHDAQDDHRDHVAAHLDARLGTRASQTSADLLTATLAAVSSDVSHLAADTSNRQGAIDALDGDVARIEGKVDGLQSDAESIDASQDEQSDFTEAFRDLVLHIRIQENLLASPNRAVALFQLPEAHGGHLETVREVVADALLRSAEAGLDSRTAQRELARGDEAFGRQDYETAYDHYGKAYRDAVKN